MSFGFSVGDFLAVGTLIYQIGTTLRDSTGSSADYQDLVLRFDCFEQLLQTVKQQISSSQLPPSAVQAIKGHILRCKPLLEKFNTTTKKYKLSLAKKCGSGNKMKDTWRKIGWGMYKRDEILELFDGLGKQMDAIHLLLSCYTAPAVACVASQMNESVAILKRIENNIAVDLAPWTPDYKPIRFVDALDGRVLLPYEHCRNFKNFQIMLRNHFDGRPGSNWVNTGLFEILNESQMTPLTIQNWEETIMPNMELSMSILLKQQQRSSERPPQDCPSCGVTYKGYGKCTELERVRCLNCRTWFQISSEPRVVELSDDDKTQNRISEERENSSTSHPVLNENDRRLIRRFHVVLNEEELHAEREIS
ncbi:hypothetical protein K440DRAFT_625716, partial [Wilcoxina mikolae CBS 423.85]